MAYRYTVVATLADKTTRPEYLAWLAAGHCQAIVDRGGAISCTVTVLDEVTIESAFLFPLQADYDQYCTGLALELRPEGKALWVDTNKVAFARHHGQVYYSYGAK